MSSAANHKQDPLEEDFWRRMHDAEATPSPGLWARIDYDLTVQENKVYKSRVVLYRQLAAACFILFMLAGGLFTYHFKNDEKVNEGIAAVQLKANAPAGAREEASIAALPTTEAQEPATTQRKEPAERAFVAEKAPSASIAKAIAATEPTARQPYSNTTAARIAGVQSVSGKWSRAAAEPVSLESIAAKHRRSFSNNELPFEQGGEAEAKTAFASLQPFYQTARQAIAAVPSGSYHNIRNSLAAQQLLRNPITSASASEVVKELNKLFTEEAKATKQQDALALALNGSDDSKSDGNNKNSRWTVGMAYAPSYFDQNMGLPDQMMSTVSMKSFAPGGPSVNYAASQDMDEAREEFEENTEPGFSYTFDARLGFKLGKKLKLLTGLGYSQNTARTKSGYIVQQFLMQSHNNDPVALAPSTALLPALENGLSTDSISVTKTDDYTVNYRYRHLTIPIGLQYEGRLAKDWYWYSSAGVAANILLQTTIMASNREVEDINYGYNDDSPFRKVQFSGNVSMGVGKRLSNAVSVSVGPEFRGYFDTLLAEQGGALAPQGRPYTFGINMAVSYDLGAGKK